MSAPMKPFCVVVENATGENTGCTRTEKAALSAYKEELTAGTHRIAKCVEEGAQGERRVVSYCRNEIGTTFAYCSDGDVLYRLVNRPQWLLYDKLPPIPQPEPAPAPPASPDLIRQMIAFVDYVALNAMDRLLEKDGYTLGWKKSVEFSSLIEQTRAILAKVGK